MSSLPVSRKRFTDVIFDLGDVLFTWSASNPKSPVPAKTVGKILRSHHWLEFEKGNLEEAEAYSLVAKQFNLSLFDVKTTFQLARDSLQSNPEMLKVIQELKASGVKVYAMSNISAPDWAVLSTKAAPEQWALFEYTFISAAAHERKPNVGFFKQVIEKTKINPYQTIFVDDKVENVLTARSFGMHGIVFDDPANVVKTLKNLCFDPIKRGQDYLKSHRQQFLSVASNNLEIPENFAQLLILELTGDESLVKYIKHQEQFNFYRGDDVKMGEGFPNDMDTTSIGLTVVDYIDEVTKHKVMDEMLQYKNADGIIQVYFDHLRPRIDPVVCINVLTLFFSNGRGHELSDTLDWVESVLRNRAYISGTYYYHTPDQFLFFLSRLIHTSTYVRRRLELCFRERVMERFGLDGDPLSLAGRIMAATTIEVVDEADLSTLLSMQSEDGSWENGWFYKYPSSGILIKNDGLTTALALKAIQGVGQLRARIESNRAGASNAHLSGILAPLFQLLTSISSQLQYSWGHFFYANRDKLYA